MKILVVGASGLVGGNIVNELKKNKVEYLGTHFSYPTDHTFFLNTQNLETLIHHPLILNFVPDVIIHCGALTYVDKCEQEPKLSKELTVDSTENLIHLAKIYKAKFVYFSTDYVFDGEKGLYSEDEPKNPINVYGEHKALAEEIVINSGLDCLILRITNVYGNEIRGKNFVSRIIALSKANQESILKLPIDQFATPINASFIAFATYQLLINNFSGIFNISSTDFMNRVQLAESVLNYFPSEKILIERVETQFLNQAAKRPLLGGLLNKKLALALPNLKFTNLDDYLSNL
jgi:dTDP-4-dehydrorhamnose reductase